MKTDIIKKLFVLLICLSFVDVSAWGPTGHRVVGKIATEHLSKKAKKNLEKVIGSQSLARISNWMDDIKSDDRYDHMSDWHWVTIPDGKTYPDTETNRNGDIIQTLNQTIDVLSEGGLSREEEEEYIKILVHLVGDLHQPLHVGTGEDAGGNRVRVKWFGRSSNLHRVFDSDVIESFQLSYSELAEDIDHATEQQVDNWQSGTVMDWAHEAMQYRKQVYDIPDSQNLGYEFRYKNRQMIETQLLKAGIRLAGILNRIYG